jgi:hypothetical protein
MMIDIFILISFFIECEQAGEATTTSTSTRNSRGIDKIFVERGHR